MKQDFERKVGPRRQMNDLANAWQFFCKRIEMTDNLLKVQKAEELPYLPTYLSDDALAKWMRPEASK